MARPVQFTRRASRELHRIAGWFNDEKAGLGERWLRGIEQVIASLSENPDRCGISRESDQFPYELRELYYGVGRSKTHRVLFRIAEDAVIILGVRHFSQQDVTADDF